jgi:hypothetical protein
MKQVETTHVPVRIIDGMSFLEPVCSALGLDPHPKLVLTDSLYLASLEIPFFPASVPALISNMRPGMEAKRPQTDPDEQLPGRIPGQADPQCRFAG